MSGTGPGGTAAQLRFLWAQVVAPEPLRPSPPLAWCSFTLGPKAWAARPAPLQGPFSPPSALCADPQSRRHRVGDGCEACAGPHPGAGEWGAQPCAVPGGVWAGGGTCTGRARVARAHRGAEAGFGTCSAVAGGAVRVGELVAHGLRAPEVGPRFLLLSMPDSQGWR